MQWKNRIPEVEIEPRNPIQRRPASFSARAREPTREIPMQVMYKIDLSNSQFLTVQCLFKRSFAIIAQIPAIPDITTRTFPFRLTSPTTVTTYNTRPRGRVCPLSARSIILFVINATTAHSLTYYFYHNRRCEEGHRTEGATAISSHGVLKVNCGSFLKRLCDRVRQLKRP